MEFELTNIMMMMMMMIAVSWGPWRFHGIEWIDTQIIDT